MSRVLDSWRLFCSIKVHKRNFLCFPFGTNGVLFLQNCKKIQRKLCEKWLTKTLLYETEISDVKSTRCIDPLRIVMISSVERVVNQQKRPRFIICGSGHVDHMLHLGDSVKKSKYSYA